MDVIKLASEFPGLHIRNNMKINNPQKRLEYLFEPFLWIEHELEHFHLSFIIDLNVIWIGDLQFDIIIFIG